MKTKLPFGWPRPPHIPQHAQEKVRDLIYAIVIVFLMSILCFAVWLFVTS